MKIGTEEYEGLTEDMMGSCIGAIQLQYWNGAWHRPIKIINIYDWDSVDKYNSEWCD